MDSAKQTTSAVAKFQDRRKQRLIKQYLAASDRDEKLYLALTLYDVCYRPQVAEDGGPGSGNFGHKGRKGEVGGSAPDSGGSSSSSSGSSKKESSSKKKSSTKKVTAKEESSSETKTSSEKESTSTEESKSKATSEASENQTEKPSEANTTDVTPLKIDTPESRAMYNRIQAGDYLTPEEMAASPVMQQLDAESQRWTDQYPHLEEDNSPERVQLRQEIKENFLKAGSAVQQEDGSYDFTGEIERGFEAEVVIGLPASGKSTTIANPDSEAMKAFVFDSDIIKESIPEFQESNGAAANAVHEESKNILKEAFAEFKAGGSRNGDNLVIPVIGDDYGKLFKKWITPLEEAGYNVKVKYKDTDPVVSLNRNMARAIKTGRIIPSETSLGYGNKPKEVYDRFVAENKDNARGNKYV